MKMGRRDLSQITLKVSKSMLADTGIGMASFSAKHITLMVMKKEFHVDGMTTANWHPKESLYRESSKARIDAGRETVKYGLKSPITSEMRMVFKSHGTIMVS